MQATSTARSPADCFAWADLPDEELLGLRICDLGLTLEGSAVEARAERLGEELATRGIRFRPRCYLTREWLCPDRVPLVGIPFCLAHPRLLALERSQMLEVEGETERSCMQLLRHEAGHALNYAYALYRRSRWRQLFGPISREYNVTEYYPRKYSHQFVEHLPDNYAQAHPDEDFAETFAVWLTPGLDWRRKYSGWKALKKLEYVDHLMRQIGDLSPTVSGGPKLWPVERVRSTLRTYFRKKQRDFGDGYPGFYDPELLKIFVPGPGTDRAAIPAAKFLKRHRRPLTNHIAALARMRKYEVDSVLRRMLQRCSELNLWLPQGEGEAMLRLAISLTALLCDRRYQEAQGRE